MKWFANTTRALLRVGILTVLSTLLLSAEVTFQETNEITGGAVVELLQKMAGDPNLGRSVDDMRKRTFEKQTFDVYIKRNQMARIGPHLSSIYDLDAGTITIINHDNQTYTVQTFGELSEKLQQMQRRFTKSQVDPTFDAKVSKTGQTRQIDGETANEALLTLTAEQTGDQGQMTITVHTWLVAMNPLRQEAHDFQKRLGDKAASAFWNGVSPLLGFASSGLSAAMREVSKLSDGYPALSTSTVTGSFGAGNAFGALAALSGDNHSDSSAPLIATESRFHNFVRGVIDDSKFTVPAGYKLAKISGQ